MIETVQSNLGVLSMRSMYDLYKVVRRRNKYRSLKNMDRLRFTYGDLLKEKEQSRINDFTTDAINLDQLISRKNRLLKV